MQKAHLYEALYLVNHGIDEAVRGVQRLKKAPHAFREVYYKSVAGLERRRALINGQFMHEMSGEEEDNASFFEEEFNRWLSDDPLDNEEIYKLVRLIEDERKKMGEPPPILEAEKTRERKRGPQTSIEGNHPKTQKPPAKTKAQEQSDASPRRLGRTGRVTRGPRARCPFSRWTRCVRGPRFLSLGLLGRSPDLSATSWRTISILYLTYRVIRTPVEAHRETL